jgi:hypothetical protein
MRNDERVAMYRRRASDLRIEGKALSDADTRRSVLEIAERYDRLAALIEAKDRAKLEVRHPGR